MTQPVHSERAHAKRGASSAHRWMACPGSLNQSAGIVDPGSEYAAEGTAAHEVADMCLTQGQDAITFVGRSITVGKFKIEVTEEMTEAVQVYVDYVNNLKAKSPNAHVMIEHKFDLSNVVLPGMFGTNDACVYDPDTGVLEVIDYKHGQGYAVDAVSNPQLLYYALGAATTDEGRALSTIKITIVQPRAPHREGPIRSWETDPFALMEWTEELKRSALATEDPSAPLISGSHCKFCPAAGTCPQIRKDAENAANLEFAPVAEDLTKEQVAAILKKADLIETWIKAVRAHAFQTLDRGGEIPGFKLVAKRATRKWLNDDVDFMTGVLASQFDLEPSDITTPKLLTPSQLEKKIPKTLRAELANFYDKKSSGATMAKAEDPREAVTGTGSADEEFEALE